MYNRHIYQRLKDSFFKKKVVILYGARQVGKTTLCRQIMDEYPGTLYVTGDDNDLLSFLDNAGLSKLKSRLKTTKLLIIDEAQKIRNIGDLLKVIVDGIPEVQVIATGSSSFDLANHVNEALTGRKFVFYLHPLSMREYGQGMPLHQLQAELENRLVMGMYPQVVIDNSLQSLYALSESYVYKDIFLYEFLKKPDIIVKLLQALALQIGSEVSIHELAQITSVDDKTVIRYLGLLEQAFIIFRLPAFSRNMRNEIKKSQKIFFRDVGVRNAMIRNTNPIMLRNDIGALRENLVIAERLKYLQNSERYAFSYFRRSFSQQEIDYIEEQGGVLTAFEIKWSPKKRASIPNSFREQYGVSDISLINKDTRRQYVGL